MDKLPIFNWFISSGDVLITVDTRVDGVDIPAHLKRQEVVDFILGAAPTPKLLIEDDGLKVPMRFSGTLHGCFFPWNSVLQISSQDAVIQFRNKSEADSQQFDKESTKKASRNDKKERPNLRLVK